LIKTILYAASIINIDSSGSLYLACDQKKEYASGIKNNGINNGKLRFQSMKNRDSILNRKTGA